MLNLSRQHLQEERQEGQGNTAHIIYALPRQKLLISNQTAKMSLVSADEIHAEQRLFHSFAVFTGLFARLHCVWAGA